MAATLVPKCANGEIQKHNHYFYPPVWCSIAYIQFTLASNKANTEPSQGFLLCP